MGASLGGLAMLHAQRRFPRTFGGAVPAVGRFFMPRHDAQERRFPRFAPDRPLRRASVLRDGEHRRAGPGDDDLRDRGGEPRQQPRDGAGAGRRRGTPVSLDEVPDMHNYIGWRDALRPAPDRLLRGGAGAMTPPRRALLARDRRRRHGRRSTATTAGRCSSFPSEGGSAWDCEDNGMVGAVGGLLDGRPGQALLRRLLRRGVVVERVDSRSRSAPASTARYESWILDQVVPFIHDDMRRRAGDRSPPASASAPSTPPTSRSSARTCSRWRSACRATTTRRLERLGRARRGGVLQQPDRLRRPPGRRPPRLAALAR